MHNAALHQLNNEHVRVDHYILVHIGNIPKDTTGCLIPGTSRIKDAVGESGPLLRRLNEYIRLHNGNVKIIIHDPEHGQNEIQS